MSHSSFRSKGLIGRVASEMIPFPFSSISKFDNAEDGTLLSGATSPGRSTPRTIIVSFWLLTAIERSASTTKFSLGRTAITLPARLVRKRELAFEDPLPLSVVDD